MTRVSANEELGDMEVCFEESTVEVLALKRILIQHHKILWLAARRRIGGDRVQMPLGRLYMQDPA
jgi:hypothetical protein